MGLTISDRHQMMYSKWRQQGMSHKEAMQNIPKKMRERFIKDLEMSPIESHFGMKDKWLFVTLIATVLGAIILGLTLS